MAISRRFPLTVLSLCFATCFNPALASTATEGYYRFPAVQQNQLVFTAEGDIWHSALDKQQTQRLTTHPALEREPLLAGDGQTLAVGAAAEDSASTGIGGDQNDNLGGSSGAVYLY